METAQTTTEEALYKNLSSTREDKPDGYPTDNYTNPNDKVAKTNGSGNKTGPAIILKVMAGDKFSIRVNSWYKLNGASPGSVADPLSDIVSALISGVPAISGGHISAGNVTSTVLNPNVNDYLNFRNTNGDFTTKPKAYINAILLDDQFKAVNTNDGKNAWFEQVGIDQEFKTHLLQEREITKNGYLYIYTSNEATNIDVFFDNLQVTHIRGPLLEETHYYPFGLTMSGISSKALKSGYAENKIKFQGQEFATKEFSDGSGLEMYEFKYRMDDPQTGRFWSIDPLADKYVYNSPYAFSENKVTRHVELEGLEAVDGINLFIWAYTALKGQADRAVGATYNMASGQSGHSYDNTPLPGPVKEIKNNIEKAQDYIDASQPAITVLQATNTLASLTPVTEAGAATEALPFLFRGSEEIAGNALKSESSSTLSPNVQKVVNTLNEIKSEGGTVKLNPLKPNQEINMTVQKGAEKLDFRIETHTVPQKYGGNGVTPQRHMNVDLHPNKKVLPNSGHKIL